MVKNKRQYFRLGSKEEITLKNNAKARGFSIVSDFVRVRTIGNDFMVEERVAGIEIKMNHLIGMIQELKKHLKA